MTGGSHIASSTPREERVVARVEARVRDSAAWAVRWWWHFRLLFFVVFLLLAVVLFWLWFITLMLGVLRFVLSGLAVILAWLGGRGPHGSGPGTAEQLGAGLRDLWRKRASHYHELARPVATGVLALRHMLVQWWRWSPGYKILALTFTLVFVGVPMMYVVPRPQVVQILDDNAIEHNNAGQKSIRYLIHAVSLSDPGTLYEYENERAVWLGKIDPQGLKNKLVVGRYYKLWVIGIRWRFLPTLFPNIISAHEVDASGNLVESPSHLIPHVPSQAVQ